VNDPRELLRRYLAQQVELGAPPVVLDARRPTPTEPAPDERNAAPTPAPTARGRGDEGPTARAHRTAGTAPAGGARWHKDLPPIPERGLVVPPPPQDLFATDPLRDLDIDALAARVRDCTTCRLHESRTHAVPGEGPADARLVVVGEGPGANEDAQGRPFVGRAGDLLNDILAAIACPRETVYITNVVKCRPPENRKPAADEAEACLPYLHRQLAMIRPKVILAMGSTAAEALLKVKAPLSALRTKVHDWRGIPLVVTYHPAALLRNPHWKRPTWDDVRIARQLLDG
jgi:uracil-DNA glycosylase family 4